MVSNDLVKVADLERLQESLPFLIFAPRDFEMAETTMRKEGRKWATLRFISHVGSERIRVKEFFLDWFYTGFPKSLMDSFVSSYSKVEAKSQDDRAIFYGRNYKNLEASSSFALGTQIEVEGETREGIEKLSENLFPPFMGGRFESLPFLKRSFFARGGIPEWFEEARISRLEWKEPSEKTNVGSLALDSVGILHKKGKRLESVHIFSDEYYRRSIWVDTVEEDPSEDHLFYELRAGGNFFNSFSESGPRVAFRNPFGPALYQHKIDHKITTISFSPLFSLAEVNESIGILEESNNQSENLI